MLDTKLGTDGASITHNLHFLKFNIFFKKTRQGSINFV